MESEEFIVRLSLAQSFRQAWGSTLYSDSSHTISMWKLATEVLVWYLYADKDICAV